MMLFDCFPFFNELDMLEIRLHELAPLVDKFIIVEAAETYGGEAKPLYLARLFEQERFREFEQQIVYCPLDRLDPACQDRISGRQREAYQRNALLGKIHQLAGSPDDVVMFSDCDEIPRWRAVRAALPQLKQGIVRLKQRSYYYSVNWLVDYGSDFASRARLGTLAQIEQAGSMYAFRMAPAASEVEEAGWHFSYFGDLAQIQQKVAALAPFLAEYRLFGEAQLRCDMAQGRDLHHRHSAQMPPQFTSMASDDQDLPEYLLSNRDRFAHFFTTAGCLR